jgi:hypothetical protein
MGIVFKEKVVSACLTVSAGALLGIGLWRLPGRRILGAHSSRD